ncbi:hypothetical protein BLA60_16640 [Actinophytocola xinjiangensis]|uniref:PPE family protein n=2 Tax=Actinophytocola xinjiangensis TaxID=485602 RepID=A0A7Z1AXB9_9PSEU|nr:hypothetical protein BLA60_16640 [Actinophytocola xinjiangensis]
MFMTGQMIYDSFVGGVGPEGLATSAERVRVVAGEYEQESTAIRRLAARTEAAWQGRASRAAVGAAETLAAEHDVAMPLLLTAQDLNARQVASFVDARNAVVPVPPEPQLDPWGALSGPGTMTTHRDKVIDYNQTNQHNVDVMRGYASAASYNSTNMPGTYGTFTVDQADVDLGPAGPGGGFASGSASDSVTGPGGGGTGVAEWTRPEPASASSAPPVAPSPQPPPQQASPPQTVPQQAAPFTPPFLPSVSTPGGVTAPAGVSERGVPTPGSGPGERGPGAPVTGSGGGTGVLGSGDRGPVGRPGAVEFGPGRGVPGGRPPGGETVARPGQAATGGPRAGAGPVGGAPPAGTRRSDDDIEHQSPTYLREPDPDSVFGTDEFTAPPVIGSDEPYAGE